MHRTVEFNARYSDEPEFDESGELVRPCGEDLTAGIADGLRRAGTSASDVDIHENYGWSFSSSTEHASFNNVVCPAGEECCLTVSMDSYFIKLVLMRRPRDSFERYCAELTRVLERMPEVADIKWHDYFR